MTTYAVIAANQNHSYDFFAPITTLMWEKVVGYRTICLLTDTAAEWENPTAALVKSKTLEVGAHVHHIGKIEGYQSAQAAQSSRHHAAILDLPEDDVLITGDIDMLPLNGPWFRQHDSERYAFTLWYWNAYGEIYPPYHCTAYIGASVKLWREVLDLKPTGEIGPQLQANFDRTLTRYHDSWQGWNHDELFFGARLKGSDYYPDQCQQILRQGQPPHDRIDRSSWPVTFDWSREWTDTHMIRPPASHENWIRLRPLLEHYMPEKMAWIDDYLVQYRKLRYYGFEA